MKPAGPFAQAGPRWFTIPAHRPFLDDLARGLHETLSPLGPEALADALVLTPTRRGARALADAFVRTGDGTAVLLPQIRAIGDLDEGEPPFEPGTISLELPPAISPLRRRFELARLILEHAPPEGRSLDAAGALEMADALAGFLDSVEIEEVQDTDRLVETLVEGDFAQHWRKSAQFLAVATRLWPKRLEALGLIDPTARRVRLLRLLAEQWETAPPQTPLIAAGSTGTAPATADLLAVVAKAPLGCVVLPGLDLSLAETAWEQVDEQHPQGAMKRLLDRHGLVRAQVRPWPVAEDPRGAARGRSRQRVVNEALRPAEATADWRAQIARLRQEDERAGVDPITEGLDGLWSLTARTEEEAATLAALLLREALETPALTCALITPDQALARRVSAKLSRWGVEADSSAGAPLAGFPVGVLLGLAAAAAVEPTQPAMLLGVLKHPFVRLGLDEEALATRRAALERHALRGARPRDWATLHRRLSEILAKADDAKRGAIEDAAALAHALEAALAIAARPFTEGRASVPDAARALAAAAETLSAGDGPSADLWSGGAGEAAAALLAGLIDEGDALPQVTAWDFEALIAGLLTGDTVRTGGASHPRLRILGAIEARLVRADRVILAGLEEGVWPQGAPIDPFLSRPMRTALGLPPPERRIGLSAHDFAQAVCAPDVVLLHTERRGGQPAVASRWLWRLQTLAKGANLSLPERPEVAAWAAALDAPETETPRYAPRPAPTPPVAVRPRSLYVTRVERWVRDPYAIYAQRVLDLQPLDRPDASAEARARGNAVHRALERLTLEHPHILPDDGEAVVTGLIIESLIEHGFHGAALARERPGAAQAARFVIGFERARRLPGPRILVEQTGALAFDALGGGFTVKARADRIEILGDAGAVIDFKTGRAPTLKEMSSGFAPQLTLTGAILAAGGFPEAGAAEPTSLAYVRVTGGRVPGETVERAGPGEAAMLAEGALAGLKIRVARFDDPSTPYVSWAAPQFMSEYGGDYDHLARVWEWAVVGEGDGPGGGE
jgi:ATP-dependent helicase/nuclease subunit B